MSTENAAETDETLRAEADGLLDSGLRSILGEYGDVHVVGSYALRLMTWRDLDIHIVRSAMDTTAFFEMGGRVAALLKPHRMHHRDETVVRTRGLPPGLYWGVYLGDERDGAWKIDIWMSDADAFESPRAFGAAIAARMSEPARRAILEIKAACWRHPEYRRGFTSSDIYSAVLDHGIVDADGFWTYLKNRG